MAHAYCMFMLEAWFLLVIIPRTALCFVDYNQPNDSVFCDELWRNVSRAGAADDVPTAPHVLCELDRVRVASDTEPVLEEDCMLPSKCEDGTLVMNLSITRRSATKSLSFTPVTNGQTTLGNYSLTKGGLLRFRPHRDKHGKTTIDLPLNIQGFSCTRRCSFQLHIVPQPDLPNLFVLNSEQKPLKLGQPHWRQKQTEMTEWLTVEQNTRTNVAYRDLDFVFGAFDADFESSRYLGTRLISQPKFGRLFIMQSDELVVRGDLDAVSCPSVEQMFENYSCLPLHVLRNGYSEFKWMFTSLRYQPREMYSGPDSFEIAVEKSSPHYSTRFYSTMVKIAVLENLCHNNGTCVGDAVHNKDMECKSPIRMNGFYRLHYRCACQPGWIGSYCQQLEQTTSISTIAQPERDDEEDSAAPLSDSPCQCEAPFVCSSGKCECPESQPACDQSIKPWQTAMIVVFGGIIFVCITIAIILYSRKVYPNFK